MGRIGKNLKAEIDQYIEQCIETRLGYNQSAFTYGPSGDDSPPVKDDRIVLVQVDGTGKFVAAGVLTVSQGAKPGEGGQLPGFKVDKVIAKTQSGA